LAEGFLEILASALVLDEKHALPERVNASVLEFLLCPGELDLLLERYDPLAVYAEDVEEGIPEGLRFGPLALRCPATPWRRRLRGRGFRSKKAAREENTA